MPTKFDYFYLQLVPKLEEQIDKIKKLPSFYNQLTVSELAQSPVLNSTSCPMHQQVSEHAIPELIGLFKSTLKQSFINQATKHPNKNMQAKISYYELAKRAETEDRNLVQALTLYTKAIKRGEKKDSSIKDFASTLHQLGYTQEAIKLMNYCEGFYDGDLTKYQRLRDNLQIQIKPTGRHLCKYLLIYGLNSEILKEIGCEFDKSPSVKVAGGFFFQEPKRVKNFKLYKNLDLYSPQTYLNHSARIILFEFESFSAAKKTLESFKSEEWFELSCYWVDYSTLQIVSQVCDGKKQFETEDKLVSDKKVNSLLSAKGNRIFDTDLEEFSSQNQLYNNIALQIIEHGFESIHQSLIHSSEANKENSQQTMGDENVNDFNFVKGIWDSTEIGQEARGRKEGFTAKINNR